jgi:hypothetical protein
MLAYAGTCMRMLHREPRPAAHPLSAVITESTCGTVRYVVADIQKPYYHETTA